MSRCENEVSYMTEIGDSMQYRETMVRCGTTDPQGDRCICEECENDSNKLRAHRDHVANVEADNAWLRSAGYNEY
jgi:hypothetical protein